MNHRQALKRGYTTKASCQTRLLQALLLARCSHGHKTKPRSGAKMDMRTPCKRFPFSLLVHFRLHLARACLCFRPSTSRQCQNASVNIVILSVLRLCISPESFKRLSRKAPRARLLDVSMSCQSGREQEFNKLLLARQLPPRGRLMVPCCCCCSHVTRPFVVIVAGLSTLAGFVGPPPWPHKSRAQLYLRGLSSCLTAKLGTSSTWRR